MQIDSKIIPISAARPGIQRVGFKGVTVHETANYRRSATAASHAVYMAGTGKNSQVSSHYYVDDTAAVLCIPENEVAWHASDGRTTPGGNMSTVAIEICTNWGYVPVELAGYQSLPCETQVSATEKAAAQDRFAAAVKNAAQLAADILHRNGVAATAGMVHQHNHWDTKNRKDCPHNLRKGAPVAWGTFVSQVQLALAALCGAAEAAQRADAGAGAGGGNSNAGNTAADNTESGVAAGGTAATPPLPDTAPETGVAALYRVQVGAFAKQANAAAFAARVKQAGFAAVIWPVEGRYHVQVGAFAVRQNAENYAKKVRAAGFAAIIRE